MNRNHDHERRRIHEHAARWYLVPAAALAATVGWMSYVVATDAHRTLDPAWAAATSVEGPIEAVTVPPSVEAPTPSPAATASVDEVPPTPEPAIHDTF